MSGTRKHAQHQGNVNQSHVRLDLTLIRMAALKKTRDN